MVTELGRVHWDESLLLDPDNVPLLPSQGLRARSDSTLKPCTAQRLAGGRSAGCLLTDYMHCPGQQVPGQHPPAPSRLSPNTFSECNTAPGHTTQQVCPLLFTP